MIDNKQDATVQNWKKALEQIAKYDNQNIPITGGSGTNQQSIGNVLDGIYTTAGVNWWYRPYPYQQPCPGCGRCPVCGLAGGHFGPYW